MRIVRFPALAAAYSVVLRTPPSGAAPHKKRMVIGPLHVNVHGPLTILFLRGFSLKCKKTPRCPILPGSCPPSTFSAEGLYFCVRYVNRCFPFAIITRSILRFYSVVLVTQNNIKEKSFQNVLMGSRPRPISTGQLHTLLHFHLQPIYLVVFQRPYFFRMRYLILRGASCLDAFSTYPFQT